MRHENNGLAAGFPDALDVAVEVLAGQGVQRGEGFVHEQHAGVGGQSSGEGDALLHAAREFMNVGAFEFFQSNEVEVVFGNLLAFLGIQARLEPEAEEDIAHDIQPREKRVLLEHDHAVATGAGDVFAVGQNLSTVRLVEAGDEVQERRLAAAAGADEAEEFTLADFHTHIVECENLAALGGEGLRDIIRLDAFGGCVGEFVFEAHRDGFFMAAREGFSNPRGRAGNRLRAHAEEMLQTARPRSLCSDQGASKPHRRVFGKSHGGLWR